MPIMIASCLPLLLVGVFVSVAQCQVCFDVVTATQSLEPALKPHADLCPSNGSSISYYLQTINAFAGCCTSTARALQKSDGLACCPCGAFCTGDAAPTLEDWTINGGNYAQAVYERQAHDLLIACRSTSHISHRINGVYNINRVDAVSNGVS
jgi:hypothetical protein